MSLNTKRDAQIEMNEMQCRKEHLPKRGNRRSSGLFNLFCYANALDVCLMIVGALASIANGLSMPIMAVVFGKMTNVFIDVAVYGFSDAAINSSSSSIEYNSKPLGTNQDIRLITVDDFTDAISQLSNYYLYISLGVFASVFIQTLCWETACERQTFRLRQIFFSQLLRQDIAWYDSYDEGDLTHKLADDLERVREGIGVKFSMLIQYGATFIGGVAVGFEANAQLTTAMIVLAPIVIGVSGVVAWAMSTSASREQIRYGVAGAIASEVLNSMEVVASFTSEKRVIQRYEEALELGKRITMRKYYILSSAAALIFFSTYGAFAAAFWYGGQLIGSNVTTPGHIFTVFFSVMNGAFTVGNALPFINAVSTAVGAFSSVFSVIDREPDIDSFSMAGVVIENLFGTIEFVDVEFSYPSRPETKIINGLNLKIEPGQSVALVGESGTGKSTVVGLLLRFYEPLSGQINIDHTNINSVNLAWLRNQIGIVSQEPVLFGVTIAENIRYGQEGAKEEDIVKAARLANAHDFIKTLPNRYETEVGEKGTMLSGGQKQRIAIARALVRNPAILILDEATSALDSQSERVVQDALENAMRGRTTIIISHRLSTIKNVDVIYVLKNGRISEKGTHEELMTLNGQYFDLVTTQRKRNQAPEDSSDELPKRPPSKRVRRSSGVLSRKISSSGDLFFEGLSKLAESSEDLAKKVSFLKIIKMNLSAWPYLLGTLVGCAIVGMSMPTFSSLYADIFQTFTLRDQELYDAVKFWTAIYAGFAIVTGIANYASALCSSIFTEKIIMDLRLRAFTNMVRQSVSWFDEESHAPGRLITSLARDPPLIKSAAGYRASQIFVVTVSVATGVIIATYTSWFMALELLVIAPIVVGAAYKQTTVLKRNQKRDAKLIDKAGQVASEAVINLKTVQALGKEKLFIKRFADLLLVPFKEAKKQALVYATVFAISQAVVYIMYAVAFQSGGHFIGNGEMSPTEVYRVFFALSFCAVATGQASTYFQDFAKAKLSIGFVYRLMSVKSTTDSLDITGLKPEIKGKVTFQDIFFSYPTRVSVAVLKGLNLTINPGQTVALVGSSGCGKSTLVGLLERFYEPNSGTIAIDDFDITQINLTWLRSHIGFVNQEPVLFDCSIRDNIKYGARNSQEVSDVDVVEAAKTANIHEFIASLPQGYDTFAGERGAKLSGGQKQRIAIARALIRNPKILLLDEATSALDAESESIVQEALNKARKGRTSIVIAHRLSTVQNADLIAVIQNGKVAELGNHDALMSSKGLYYEFVNCQ